MKLIIIFLTKNRERLMSMEEHIVIEFLFHNRLLKLTHEERKNILKLRELLTILLMD